MLKAHCHQAAAHSPQVLPWGVEWGGRMPGLGFRPAAVRSVPALNRTMAQAGRNHLLNERTPRLCRGFTLFHLSCLAQGVCKYQANRATTTQGARRTCRTPDDEQVN